MNETEDSAELQAIFEFMCTVPGYDSTKPMVRELPRLVDELRLLTTAGRRGERDHVPARRPGYTQKVHIGEQALFLRTGEYPDGRLAEIFIDIPRQGSFLQAVLGCFAKAVSLGLQYGVPLEEFVDAFVHARFDPSGPVDGDSAVARTTSVVDYIFRDLGISYLQRDDLRVGARLVDQDALQARKPSPPVTELSERTFASQRGYTGNTCGSCSSVRMQRSGSCEHCLDCGSTTGCS